MCSRIVLTKRRIGSRRLFKAVVVQRLINLSAAQRALKSQKCSNSSFKTHARWIRRLPLPSALSIDESFFERLDECLYSNHRRPCNGQVKTDTNLSHFSK